MKGIQIPRILLAWHRQECPGFRNQPANTQLGPFLEINLIDTSGLCTVTGCLTPHVVFPLGLDLGCSWASVGQPLLNKAGGD